MSSSGQAFTLRSPATTAASTNSLASKFSKILIFEYFQYLKIGIDVFFDADSESPPMT